MSALRKIARRLSQWHRQRRISRVHKLLRQLGGDSSYVKHCRRELSSWFEDDGPNRWMAEHIELMLMLFATEGHSGSSAPFAVKLFGELARFKPWGPLTGAEDEWGEPFDLDGTQQNKRCSHVFRGADGRAYDADGRVFRDPDGCCYTNIDSRVYIEFPYTPTTVYVDRPAEGGGA